HLHRPRRAGGRVPPGVVRRRRDRRGDDELPDARHPLHRPRRRHDHRHARRPAGGPPVRRLPGRHRGAGVRRLHPDHDRRGRGGRPGVRGHPPRPRGGPGPAHRRGAGGGRAHRRRGGSRLARQGGPAARRRRRRGLPAPGPHPRGAGGPPARPLRGRQRGGGGDRARRRAVRDDRAGRPGRGRAGRVARERQGGGGRARRGGRGRPRLRADRRAQRDPPELPPRTRGPPARQGRRTARRNAVIGKESPRKEPPHMRWHKRLLAAGAVVAMALTATACAGGQGRGSQSPAASGAPTDAAFVYVPNLEVVTEWDPASSYSNEIIAMHNIYETLTRYNPQTKKAEPLLATSWTSSDEGKKWTFTLRQGVTFHTGKPLDAKAAKAAIERTKKLGDGAAYIWDAVDKIEAKDDFTLEFKLKYPVPLDLVASSGYAAFIYDTTAVDGDSDDLKKWFNEGNDAGTGPYTVESWRKGEEVELTLKAYDQYWGGWDGPHYKKVSYRVTPEITTAWQLLQRGEVAFVPRLNPQLFAQAGSAENVQTSQTPSFQNLLLLFNTASGPLKDVRLRKAIQKAIDYDGLLAALQGSGVAASGFVPEGLLGHVPGRTPKQDLAGAEALLKEAGYGPGGKQLELELTYAQGDNDQQVLVTLLSSTLDKLNVKLSAKALQWNTQWDQGKAKDPEKRQDIDR